MTVSWAACLLLAYLVGTIPSALWLAGWRGHDPTAEGSGNPGATNVFRVAGKAAGSLTLLLDIAKGVGATGLGLAVDGRPLALACWVAATLGHIFPVTRRLRGGKGVATAGGGAFVLFPWVSLILLGLFLAVARLGRRASAGSLAIAFGLIFLVAATGRPQTEIAVTAALVGVVIVRHWSNILRLLRREEHSLV